MSATEQRIMAKSQYNIYKAVNHLRDEGAHPKLYASEGGRLG
jgi:hypothetical protein